MNNLLILVLDLSLVIDFVVDEDLSLGDKLLFIFCEVFAPLLEVENLLSGPPVTFLDISVQGVKTVEFGFELQPQLDLFFKLRLIAGHLLSQLVSLHRRRLKQPSLFIERFSELVEASLHVLFVLEHLLFEQVVLVLGLGELVDMTDLELAHKHLVVGLAAVLEQNAEDLPDVRLDHHLVR